MYLRVTINEGMGSVRCGFPAFGLDEEKKKSIFVTEMTEQLKRLEEEGIVSIDTVTEKQYNEHRQKVSDYFNKKAKDNKRKDLERIIKTGGKNQILTGTGIIVTEEPGEGVSPEEIKRQAEAELKALDGDDRDLRDLITELEGK